ncbi:DUF3021 family protein [Huintestinicola sp.]|uniref:DUF3021 family protein n=1 Tax=Huintestinicola sp. TaxID=2981661 RepID=UPI003D7CC66E
MKKLSRIAKLFTMIASGILLVATVYITVFWGPDTEISIKVLWQIIAAAALCSLVELIFPSGEKEPSKKAMLILTILCFVYVNAVVLTCAFVFEWIRNKDPLMITAMELCIIAVFAGVYAIGYFSDRREAEKMNRILSRNDKDKNR